MGALLFRSLPHATFLIRPTPRFWGRLPVPHIHAPKREKHFLGFNTLDNICIGVADNPKKNVRHRLRRVKNNCLMCVPYSANCGQLFLSCPFACCRFPIAAPSRLSTHPSFIPTTLPVFISYIIRIGYWRRRAKHAMDSFPNFQHPPEKKHPYRRRRNTNQLVFVFRILQHILSPQPVALACMITLAMTFHPGQARPSLPRPTVLLSIRFF